MTPDDFDQAVVDLDLHRRAAARCTVSVPHRDVDEDVPCSGCLLAAARQLAIPASHLSAPASTSSSVAPPPIAEGVNGAAGVRAPFPARQGQGAGGSASQTDNRPEGQKLRAAYRPNVLGQNGR